MQKLVLSNNARQKSRVFLEDGTVINFTFRFLPTQSSWNFDVEAVNFNLNGQKLTRAANVLYQYQRTIGWGLGVATKSGLDPDEIDDFETGEASVYVLEKSDVELVNE